MAVGGGPFSIAVGDFDGDGEVEPAIANAGSNAVNVLLGSGSGREAPAAGSPVAVGTTPAYIVAGDFNGDGRLDFAATGPADGVVGVLQQQ